MTLEDQTLKLIGRDHGLFEKDISFLNPKITKKVQESNFLIIGGAGSIGQSVTKEIFKRSPLKLHVIDISENNMVELVRDIRSTLGYIDGDFRTFAIDCGGLPKGEPGSGRRVAEVGSSVVGASKDRCEFEFNNLFYKHRLTPIQESCNSCVCHH